MRLSLSRLPASLTSATAACRISYRSSKAFLTQEAKVAKRTTYQFMNLDQIAAGFLFLLSSFGGFEILCLRVSVWSDVLHEKIIDIRAGALKGPSLKPNFE